MSWYDIPKFIDYTRELWIIALGALILALILNAIPWKVFDIKIKRPRTYVKYIRMANRKRKFKPGYIPPFLREKM